MSGMYNAWVRLKFLASEVGAGLVGFVQAGAGAVLRTVQSKLRESVSVRDFGAVGDGVADDTAAIQAAIDSGAYEIRVPYGAYRITSSILIDNKRGFSLVGLGGNDKSSIVWDGAAGGVMVEVTRMRQFIMRGILLVGSLSASPVAATCLRITSASGNTNTLHTYEDCLFSRVTGRAVDLNGANWQLDMIYFIRCIWSQMDVGVYISGASTFMIHFDGGTMGDFTSYGWRCVTGGTLFIRNMGFIQGGVPGAALVGTPWIVSRARTFGEVNVENCQHEGNSLFFQGEDDSGGAQATSVTIKNCTIGPTAGGTYNVIDYRQRGQFIWVGGNIGSSYGTSCLAYFAKPGSAGDGGNVHVNGVKNDGTIQVTISGNTYLTGYDKNGALQAGNGIKFPATQVASSNANTLDDYEEGTFTPVVYGSVSAGVGTYQQQSGEYTKVGRLVFVSLKLAWSAHTGTGNMRISGMPFNMGQGVASVFANGLTYAGTHLQPFIVNNEIWLSQTSSGAADTYIAMDSVVGQLELTLTTTV